MCVDCGWLVSFFFLGGRNGSLQHDEVEMMTGLRSIYEALMGWKFHLVERRGTLKTRGIYRDSRAKIQQ